MLLKKLRKTLLKDNSGNFTLEAAMIVPIIVCIIALCLLLTVDKYHESEKIIAGGIDEYRITGRFPKEVINNTDLVSKYIEKIKDYLKEGEK